jgi:hypothetical protein
MGAHDMRFVALTVALVKLLCVLAIAPVALVALCLIKVRKDTYARIYRPLYRKDRSIGQQGDARRKGYNSAYSYRGGG